MTNTPGDSVDIRDEIAIAAILEGRPNYEAAEIAGYSARTLQRRQREPAFQRRLAEARHNRVTQIADQLGNLVDEALNAIRRSLAVDEASSVALRAASLVLDRYRAFRGELEVADELSAMREELADLRAALDGRDSAASEVCSDE